MYMEKHHVYGKTPCMLENDINNFVLYTNALNNTIKDVVMRKLPHR